MLSLHTHRHIYIAGNQGATMPKLLYEVYLTITLGIFLCQVQSLLLYFCLIFPAKQSSMRGTLYMHVPRGPLSHNPSMNLTNK